MVVLSGEFAQLIAHLYDFRLFSSPDGVPIEITSKWFSSQNLPGRGTRPKLARGLGSGTEVVVAAAKAVTGEFHVGAGCIGCSIARGCSLK